MEETHEALVQAWENAVKNCASESKWDVMDLAEKLVPALEDYPPIRQILHSRHAYGGNSTVPQPLEFGMHFVRRTLAVGVEPALIEIDRFMCETHLEFQQVVALLDTQAVTAHTFCNGVSIISGQDVWPSALARHLNEQNPRGLFSDNLVYAVLARTYRVEKNMLPLDQEPAEEHPAFRDDDDLTWTRLAISLHAQGGAPELFRQVSVPDKYGFLQRVFPRLMRMDLSRRPTCLEVADLTEVDKAIGEIGSFAADQAPRLLILLDQFHRARLAFNEVQRAIHLRICIENVFIEHGEKEEVASKVKSRGAAYLEVSKTAADKIYDALSSAVHRGQLLPEARYRPHDIEARVQSAIRRILEEGSYPTWRQ